MDSLTKDLKELSDEVVRLFREVSDKGNEEYQRGNRERAEKLFDITLPLVETNKLIKELYEEDQDPEHKWESSPLSYDDVAEIYFARRGRDPSRLPAHKVIEWVSEQSDIRQDADGSLYLK